MGSLFYNVPGTSTCSTTGNCYCSLLIGIKSNTANLLVLFSIFLWGKLSVNQIGNFLERPKCYQHKLCRYYCIILLWKRHKLLSENISNVFSTIGYTIIDTNSSNAFICSSIYFDPELSVFISHILSISIERTMDVLVFFIV